MNTDGAYPAGHSADAVAGISELYYGHAGGNFAGHHQHQQHYANDEEDSSDEDHATGKPLNKQQQYYLELWETRYAQLAAWKRKHKTCTVIEAKDKQLCWWVRKQRDQYRRGKLSQERKDRLDLLDFDFTVSEGQKVRLGKSPEEHWESRCHQLIAFRERHGHCKVPSSKGKASNDADRSLGQWLDSQNRRHIRGELGEERHARLVEIGVEFKTEIVTNDDQWARKFNALVEYRKVHGKGKPKRVKGENRSEYDSLANWSTAQREQYKKGKLRDDRLRKLRAIGFDFGGRTDGPWETKFAELVAYKKRHGEVQAPLRFECTQSLNEWAVKQRKKFIDNKLTKSRISRLRKLGFSFIPAREYGFDKMLENLRRYREEHGNVDVPSDYEENRERSGPSLARWVDLQREKYSRDKVSLRHYTPLEALGFTWEQPSQPEEESESEEQAGKQDQAKEGTPTLKSSLYGTMEGKTEMHEKREEICNTRWEERYSSLVVFYNNHGHCTVGRAYDKSLSKWVRTQRADYRSNNLVQERYDKLCLIDFDFKGQERQTDGMNQERAVHNAKQFEKRCKQLEEFKRENGHCNPKRYSAEQKRQWEIDNDGKFPDELRLGDWTMTCNKKYKKGELDQEKFDRLTEIGWKPYLGTTSRKEEMRWHEMFASLAAYKVEKGTAEVPNTYPENEALAKWAVVQRRAWAGGRMSQEREERLRGLGFPLKASRRMGPHKLRWEKLYDRLAAFRKKHGHTFVPKSHEDDQLHKWCGNQQVRYRQNKMKSDEEVLLRELGFEFLGKKSTEMTSSERQSWDRKYAQLVAYKAKHGNCDVPALFEENLSLSRWVYEQRKRMKEGTLAPDLWSKLEAGGFDFASKESPRRVAVTVTKPSKDCKIGLGIGQTEGDNRVRLNCIVPGSLFHETELKANMVLESIDGKGFASVNECATLLKEAEGELTVVAIGSPWEINRKKNDVPAATEPLLNAGKIAWPIGRSAGVDPEEAEWQNFFERLQQQPKHFDVRKISEENEDLKLWAQEQRRDRRMGTITKKHFDQLEELYFFDPVIEEIDFQATAKRAAEMAKEAKARRARKAAEAEERNAKRAAEAEARAKRCAAEWPSMYQKVIQFRIKHGHTRIPALYEEDPSLSRWAYEQEKRFKEGSMLADEVRMLDALAFFSYNGLKARYPSRFPSNGGGDDEDDMDDEDDNDSL